MQGVSGCKEMADLEFKLVGILLETTLKREFT